MVENHIYNDHNALRGNHVYIETTSISMINPTSKRRSLPMVLGNRERASSRGDYLILACVSIRIRPNGMLHKPKKFYLRCQERKVRIHTLGSFMLIEALITH